MGRLPHEARRYQLEQLNERHHEILRLRLLGYQTKEIANMLEITEPTVYNATHSAKGRAQLAILQGVRDAGTIDLAKDIQEFAGECFEGVKEIMRDPNTPSHLRLKYGFEVLGIAGHVKPQRVQVSGHHQHYLTTEDIDAIKERAKQLAQESGILDAEYRELPNDHDTEPGGGSDVDNNNNDRDRQQAAE